MCRPSVLDGCDPGPGGGWVSSGEPLVRSLGGGRSGAVGYLCVSVRLGLKLSRGVLVGSDLAFREVVLVSVCIWKEEIKWFV